MRGVCTVYNNKALALVARSGSCSLMLPMLPKSPESYMTEYTSDHRWHPIMVLPAHGLQHGYPDIPLCCVVRDPVPQENAEPEEKKPVLTVEQEAAVRLAYADDIALWESLL